MHVHVFTDLAKSRKITTRARDHGDHERKKIVIAESKILTKMFTICWDKLFLVNENNKMVVDLFDGTSFL